MNTRGFRARPAPCRRLRVFGVGLVLAVSSAAVPAQAPPEKDARAGPPPLWQRTLRGGDADRVKAMETTLAELEKKGHFAEAAAAVRDIMTIRHRVQGDDHWEAVDARIKERTWARVAGLPRESQTDLAAALRQGEESRNLHEKGRYAEAETLCRRSWEVYRRILGEDHPFTAERRYDLSLTLAQQAKYAEAALLCRKVLTILGRTLGEDHPRTADVYNDLALDISELGEYAEAYPLLEKSLAIRLRVLGEDHPDTAGSYNNLAYMLDGQGKYTEAEPLLRKALAIRRRTLGEDHPLTARCYNNLAYNLNGQGNFAAAEPLDRKALAIRRRTLGEDHPFTARSYNNLATDLDDQGRYVEAEPLLQQALKIQRRLLGEDHPDTALSYNNLAVNLIDRGQFAEAESLLRRALAIDRSTLGEDHHETARIYNNLGQCFNGRKDYAEAEPLFRKALAIYRSTPGESHPDSLAQAANNLAMNLNVRGKFAEAESLLREALAIQHRTSGEDHSITAMIGNNLAGTLHLQGKSAPAEAMALTAARSYAVARLRSSFAGVGRAEFALRQSPLPLVAAILARRGRGQDAWEHWEANLARGLFDDLVARRRRPLTPDERRRQEELTGRLDVLDNQLRASANARNLSDDQLKRLDELKGRRLELQGRLVQLEAELVQKYKVAAGAVYTLDRIQRQVPVDTALVGWLDLDTIPQAADPRGDHWACVVRRTGSPRWIRIMGTGADRAWVEADDRRPGDVRRLLSTDIEKGWQGPLTELAQQRLAPLEDALRALDDLPAARQLIVLPSPALAGIPVEAMLEVCPSGSPQYVVSYAPSGTLFAWLQERRGEDRGHPARARRLLALGDPVPSPAEAPSPPTPKPPDHGLMVQRVAPGSNAEQAGLRPGDVLIRYAGTELASRDDLQKLLQAADPRAASVLVSVWREGKTLDRALRRGPLGVDLDTRPAAEAILARREADDLLRRTRGESFKPLPGSRREVQAIAGLFDQSAVFLGSDASEQTLDALRSRGQLATFAVIHLATHGRIDDLAPMNSRLLLAQDHLPDPTASPTLDGPAYDGILSAGEVMSTWRLNAELVTLSACRSGLGRQSGGEGFVGFAQAFFLADSRSLLLSLWEVEDRATSLLMTRFYQNWLGKRPGLDHPLSKAEALREAKAWLRGLTGAQVQRELSEISRGEIRTRSGKPAAARPFQHPHDWAGFVLMGDPN